MPILYNTSPLIIYPLSPHLSLRKLVDPAILSSRATRIHRIIRVLVRDILRGDVNTNLRVYSPKEEGVLKYLNLNHLAELRTRQARKRRDVEDHLAETSTLQTHLSSHLNTTLVNRIPSSNTKMLNFTLFPKSIWLSFQNQFCKILFKKIRLIYEF